jgi:hypothetical protein
MPNIYITEMIQERAKAYARALDDAKPESYRTMGEGFRLSEKPGKKYTRIVHFGPHYQTGDIQEMGVHAFLENATGLIFKPAGWAGPVKYGAAYDLTNDDHFASLLSDARTPGAFAGGYLYKGQQSWRWQA